MHFPFCFFFGGGGPVWEYFPEGGTALSADSAGPASPQPRPQSPALCSPSRFNPSQPTPLSPRGGCGRVLPAEAPPNDP